MRAVNADHREAVARIVEQAQRAADSWTVLHSDFHTPPVVADALMVLQVQRCLATRVAAASLMYSYSAAQQLGNTETCTL
jgi:RNA-binding protein YlmH